MSQQPSPERPTRTVPARDDDPTRGLAAPTRRTAETDTMKESASRRRQGASPWTWPLVRRAAVDAVRKLHPRKMAGNPVMLAVELGSVLVTVAAVRAALDGGDTGFTVQIAAWLWFTVLFANFAEAIAEARGRAQADSLRTTSQDVPARRLSGGAEEQLTSNQLRRGDVVEVREGEIIPGDGEVIGGVAYVNEAAITGESAPVLKEPGTDIRSAVTGGTQVVSDSLRIRITANPGETFLDRMIALVEGAQRQKTPNEIALSILLAALSLIFLIVVVTLQPFSAYAGETVSVVVLAALLVTLLPTTIGALLSAIGIAGMDRVTRFNVLAMSGRAVEAAGDVDVLLLDKTGTITYGNRLADAIIPVDGAEERTALEAALYSSLGDETPEGRSIAAFARQRLVELGGDGAVPAETPAGAEVIPFSAETRTSGLLFNGRTWLKGAVDSVASRLGAEPSAEVNEHQERIARLGGTPLLIAEGGRAVGMIYLKDTVKPGMRERFAELRQMGIRTVMVTGDHRTTAATIAAEAGVDDFIAEAKPEDKITAIRRYQGEGRLVAMTGDGTNDAPALAQADVGLAMNSGTAAAREAANMVDLDSDPTKLIEVVRIGKQLLMTRGAITTFSIANDVAKYFAILPAAFAIAYPQLNAMNVMRLASPESAILSAVIFNALVIVSLIPLALRGVAYRPAPAATLLMRNLAIYGLGGLVAPFVGIKLIDLAVSAIGLA